MAVLLNTGSQVLQKFASAQLNESDHRDNSLLEKTFLLITSFPVVAGFTMAFIAAVVWMFALSKLPLSHAYPFLATSFVLVAIAGHFIFLEQLTVVKIVGLILIIIGIVISAQG